MKCIKCGKEIQPEFNNCPYCGQNLQMVPDYSIYDEEDINVIIEETKEVSLKNNRISAEKELKEKRRAKAEAEKKKKQQTTMTIIIVALICVVLLVLAVFAKSAIDKNNDNSYDYQKHQAQTAKSKGDLSKAEEYYLQALAVATEKEDAAEVRLDLAELYLSQGDIENAVKYFKDVLNYDSQNKTSYRKLFDIYSEAGDTAAILELKNSVTDENLLSIFSDYTVDAPKLGLAGGTYAEKLKITISAKRDVEIYYTLDGSNPETNGTIYNGAIEIKEEGMHTVKAVTKNSLGVFSAVVSEIYVIKYEPPKDPVITQDGDYVVISVPDNCSAYYVWSTGNETPTIEDTLYVKKIEIPDGYNYLAVIAVNDETGLSSGVVREAFEKIPEPEEVPDKGTVEE